MQPIESIRLKLDNLLSNQPVADYQHLNMWKWVVPLSCNLFEKYWRVVDDGKLLNTDEELSKAAQVTVGAPSPILQRKGAYACVYAEEAGLGGCILRNVQDLHRRYLQAPGVHGLSHNEEERVEPGADSRDARLGAIIDGKRVILHAKPGEARRALISSSDRPAPVVLKAM